MFTAKRLIAIAVCHFVCLAVAIYMLSLTRALGHIGERGPDPTVRDYYWQAVGFFSVSGAGLALSAAQRRYSHDLETKGDIPLAIEEWAAFLLTLLTPVAVVTMTAVMMVGVRRLSRT